MNILCKIKTKHGEYSLVKAMDCFGCTTYFIYLDGRQWSDSVDFYNDDAAVIRFMQCIEAGSFDDFYD